MKDFIKKNVRYYLGVLLGFQTCLFGIAGMKYMGYSFAIGFNSILSGIVIGLSIGCIVWMSPENDREKD